MRQPARTALLLSLGLLLVSSVSPGLSATALANQAEVDKCLADGQEALRNGRFEKAIKAFTKADWLAGGGSAPALIGVATAHLQMAQFDAALREAEKAVSVATEPAEQAMAQNLVGTALLGTYNRSPYEETEVPESLLRRAEAAFSQALRLSGGALHIAWSNLALVLEKQGRFADAEAVLQEYLERVPQNESARERLIGLRDEREWQEFEDLWMGLTHEGDLAEAVEVIEGYRYRSPGHPRARTRHCWLRVAGIETGDTRYDASKLEFDAEETRAKAADLPIEVEGRVVPPEFIEGPAPLYTEEARIAQIYGKVILEAVIDKAGKVRCPWILEDLPLGLGESAFAAVEQWHFEPATLDGKPVNVVFTFTVGFDLD